MSHLKCFSLLFIVSSYFFLLIPSLPNLLFSFSVFIKQKWWQIHLPVEITHLLNSGQCSSPSTLLALLKISFTLWDTCVVSTETELMRNFKGLSKAGKMWMAEKCMEIISKIKLSLCVCSADYTGYFIVSWNLTEVLCVWSCEFYFGKCETALTFLLVLPFCIL